MVRLFISTIARSVIEMFQSDFKIVAEYFVQKRKNKDYIPSETKIRHVREVLQLMNALTKDYRFEEAYNRVEKGEMFTYKDGGLHWYEDRSTKPVYTHESFRAFLNLMFMDGIYFNSAHIALSKETENVKLSDLRIGDVFVRDGDYAVIVLDIATSANGKEKCFIVAEGIMPIRDIYILKNRVATETNESPWHYVSEINNSSGGYTIGRPDYNFVTIERLK